MVAEFKEKLRRPPDATKTHLASDSFAFDDLRLYVSWVDDPALPPSDLAGIMFEIQVRTFLQHAWGIATHDLIYKGDEVNWGRSRVAYQVKAMLENAEVSISEVKRLTDCAVLGRADEETTQTQKTIGELKTRWAEPGALPKDVQRLAHTIHETARTLGIALNDLWEFVDTATASGRGASLADLSPYGAILDALVRQLGAKLFERVATGTPRRRPKHIFVPREIELPELPPKVRDYLRIVRPPPASELEPRPAVPSMQQMPEGGNGH